MYLDDYNLSATIDFKFTTRKSTGLPTQLAGSPAVSVYKTNSTTQTTTGVTLTVDFDSVTGLNHVRIDTSADGTFYAAGCDFAVVITAGTVDSISVVGETVATFSILNRSALRPTTAGRTLDVSAAGNAGIDWSNIESPTTTVAFTGTTIATTQQVDINTIKTQTVTCAAGVTVSPYVGSTGAAVNGTNVNTLAGHDPGTTLGTSTLTQAQVTGGAYALNSASFAFNAALDFTTTQKAATLARVTLVDTTTTNTDMITAAGIRTAVGMASANLDTQIGTLATAANLAIATSYIDTEVAAIKAKTDNLPAAPAATGDIAAAIVTYGLDHLVYTSVIGTDIADNSIIAKLASKSATADWDTYNNTTDSLEALRDRGDTAWITGSSGGGAGARSVTITVNDGTTVLQNASVRMSQGAESYVVVTNASGVSVFALDDATWTVTVTKAGYTFTPTTIIVNGTETATYSMTAVTVTPSDPEETTGYVTIRTLAGVEVEGAVVDVEITRWANGTTGSGITPRTRSRTTDVNGYAEFTGLPRLATYRVRVNDGEWTSSAVTLDASTTPLVAPIGPAE